MRYRSASFVLLAVFAWSALHAQAPVGTDNAFETLDANSDGQLSAHELQRMPKITTQRHDVSGPRADHSGKQPRQGQHAAVADASNARDMRKNMDTDGNGSVSLTEWENAMAAVHEGDDQHQSYVTPDKRQ